MTDKNKQALDALNYIQHSWQQKDGADVFQEECNIIRASLTAPQPEVVTVDGLIQKIKSKHKLSNSDAYTMFARKAYEELLFDHPDGVIIKGDE